jgi:hypothetical protein
MKWNMKEWHEKPSYDKINTLKWLKLKCSDPFIVQTKGKADGNTAETVQWWINAIIYNTVEKDEVLAGKYMEQGMQ